MEKTTGFIITVHGDPSVGLFDTQFRLEGEFYFENEDELNTYILGLKELHEETFDAPVSIITYEKNRQDILKELNDLRYGL